MDYKKHYDRLIETRKILNRCKGNGNYYERHHVLPKSCGGTNEENNLVLLTAKEHYIAHLLLIQCYDGVMKNKMRYAFAMMLRSNKYHERLYSASQYQRIREELSLGCMGRKLSEETKKKIGDAGRGKKYSNRKKRIYTDVELKRFSENGKNQIISDKEKERRRLFMLGRKLSDETKNKIREKAIGRPGPNLGKKRSEETIEKWKKSTIGKHGGENNPMFGREHSEDTKKKIGESTKLRVGEKSATGGRICITNGKKNKKIKKETLDSWLNQGWYKGITQKSQTRI